MIELPGWNDLISMNGFCYFSSMGGSPKLNIPVKTSVAPTNITATVDGSDIDITWDAVSTAESYNVYQSVDDGDWTKLNTTTIDALTYTLTPTDPGEYNFRVTSVLGSRESSPSNEIAPTGMMAQVYADTITGIMIAAADGTALIDAAAAVTGYADGNHYIEIEDASGNIISAILVSQGTGEVVGTTIDSGTLTEGILYKIVATEVDHFGTGLEVGDYFTSDGTEVCDGSNTVAVVITPSVNGVILEDVI